MRLNGILGSFAENENGDWVIHGTDKLTKPDSYFYLVDVNNINELNALNDDFPAYSENSAFELNKVSYELTNIYITVGRLRHEIKRLAKLQLALYPNSIQNFEQVCNNYIEIFNRLGFLDGSNFSDVINRLIKMQNEGQI